MGKKITKIDKKVNRGKKDGKMGKGGLCKDERDGVRRYIRGDIEDRDAKGDKHDIIPFNKCIDEEREGDKTKREFR